MSIVVVVVALVILVLYVLRKRPVHTSSLYPLLPTPPHVSLFSLVQVLISAKINGTPFIHILAQQYGPIVHLHVPFCRELALLTDVAYTRSFFTNKHANFFDGSKIFFDLVSPTVIRKRLITTQTPTIAKAFMIGGKYNNITKVLRERVTDYFSSLVGVQGQVEIDFFVEIRKLVVTLMARVFVGSDLQGKDLERFIFLINELDMEDRLTHLSNFINLSLPSGKKATEQYWNELQGIVTKTINQRISKGCDKEDFVNWLISENSQNGVIDYTKIAIVIYLSVFAGTTNTYATVAWTLLFLESNLEVKKAIQQDMEEYKKELEEGRDPTTLLMTGTTNSTHAIYETIRLCVNGIAPRAASEDINVEDTYVIPKGWMVFLPYYVVLQNKKVFENSDAYFPDRFLTQGKGSLENVSFGAGRHPCTGAKLAQLGTKIILYTLLDQYTFETNDTVDSLLPKNKVMGGGVARPTRPCAVRLTKRTSSESTAA